MDLLTAAQLAQVLDEPKQHLLRRVLRLLGPERTAALLVETLHCEMDGGLRTKDGTRRRTPGGTFFTLVKGQVTRDERRVLFKR